MKTRASEKTVTFTRPFVLAGLGEVLPAIDPEELDAALARDQGTAEAPASAAAPPQEGIDLRAVDRAEDEGMIARPF